MPLAAVTDAVTSGPLVLGVLVAALAGLVSFLSPCVLPLVPGYLSYVAGVTGETVQEESGVDLKTRPVQGKRRVVLGAVLFVLGFTVVFVSFGALFGGAGAALKEHQVLITRILGVVTIALGFAYLGKLPWMQREWRIHKLPATGLAGAPLLGVVFGLGWTPCLGPTLSAVLSLSYRESTASRGAILCLAYCLGLGIPFVLIALGARWALRASQFARRHAGIVMKIGGVMLIVLGILLLTGWWDLLLFRMQGWLANTGIGTLI